MSKTTTKVIIADDHPIVVDGLAQLLEASGGEFEVVGTAGDGIAALQLIRETAPDVAVIDVRMPRMDGLEVLRRVHDEKLKTRVVLLSGHLPDDDLVQAVRLGAAGIVLKEAASRMLLQCIRVVASGRQWLEDGMMRRALDEMLRREAGIAGAGKSLTPRELEIVTMVAAGHRNRVIAEKLEISEGTVKIHIHSIYQKLGVSGRVELSNFARENGLV
jgi:DNA-binding NarL/FixJ family response regulator